MKKWDYHFHSNFSDGAHSVEELASMASEEGISSVALTDHDTVAGLKPFRLALADEIELISGVEFSSRWRKTNLHIVGLNFDPEHPLIDQLVKAQTRRRDERNQKIARKLETILRIDEDILALAYDEAGAGQLCRPHFAKAVVKLGFTNTTNDVFRRWLGNGKPAAIGVDWPPFEEVIRVLRQASGIAVIAHPLQYGLTRTKLNQLMADFANAGGQAIEIATPDIKPDQIRSLIDRAATLNMVASGGSDFHSSEWGGKKLGSFAALPEESNTVNDIFSQ